MVFRCAGKSYTITLPTQAAVVLSAFNSVDTLSYAELKLTTNMDELMLKRTLCLLCFGPYQPRGSCTGRLLIRTVATEREHVTDQAIYDTDSFSVNMQFKCKTIRITIPNVNIRLPAT